MTSLSAPGGADNTPKGVYRIVGLAMIKRLQAGSRRVKNGDRPRFRLILNSVSEATVRVRSPSAAYYALCVQLET